MGVCVCVRACVRACACAAHARALSCVKCATCKTLTQYITQCMLMADYFLLMLIGYYCNACLSVYLSQALMTAVRIELVLAQRLPSAYPAFC